MKKGISLIGLLKGLFFVCFVGMFLWLAWACNSALLVTVLLAGGILLLGYRLELPNFPLFLFGAAFLLRLVVVLTLQTPITSDFAVQLQASEQFAAGDMSFQDTSYFQTWGYQTGLVIYQGLLLKIWDSVLFLKLINCLWGAGTVLLVYLIAKEFFQEQACRCAALFYCCFLYPLTLVTIPSNNIISTFFLYLSLYLMVRKGDQKGRPVRRYLSSAVSLAVSNFFRPDTVVMLVAVLAYFIFALVSQLSKRNLIQCLKCLVTFFACYLILTNGFSQAVIRTGINSAGLENHEPLWSVLVGLNHETGGTYSEEWAAIEQRMDELGCTYEQAEWSLIQERIFTSPSDLLKLAHSKIQTFWWGDPMGWTLGHLTSDTLYQMASGINACTNWISILLAALGAMHLFRHQRGNLKAYLVPFVIFATFCAYLVVEVQSRYAYLVEVAVFVLAAGGFQILMSGVQTAGGTQLPRIIPKKLS